MPFFANILPTLRGYGEIACGIVGKAMVRNIQNGNYWHIAAFAALQNLGRCWSNNGHSNRPTNEPRSTSFKLVNDRALPWHGSSQSLPNRPLPSEAGVFC
jgi:hypothetical protein